MAMMHSLWQAALLMLLYLVVDRLTHKDEAPLAKRNFLYLTLAAQLVLFFCTFLLYFFSAGGIVSFAGMLQSINDSFASETLKLATPWIFGLYIFVIAFKLVKAVYSWYYFKLQCKTGLQKPAVELKLFTELKAYQFGIKRKVKLWLSLSVQTPVTFGYFKPIILLPVALVSRISTQQAETLILHELTHIRTNDYLLNWFLISAETIFFFNPFITGLCKKIKLEREKHCDISVISFEYSPVLYAETLLQAERIKQLIPNFQLAAVDKKKHLLQRIQFFTNDKIINKTLRFNIVAPVVGLLLLSMLSAAILFQSQKITGQMESGTDLHYLPVDNNIIANTEISTPIFADKIKAEQVAKAQELPESVIKQKDIIEPQTVSESEPQTIEEPAISADPNFARPVTTKENDAARQIIVTEEGSGSASVKTYYLSFENGKWILQPEWVISAKEVMLDSLSRKMDSLQKNFRKIYPAQQ
jgi:beta-lactamase regulating signal transducer with metallopeptidase domain